MGAYTLGLILGAVLQPSTIIGLILTIVLKKKRRSIILGIVLATCIIQWLISLNLGGGRLGIGSLLIPIISGIAVVYLISSFKKSE